MTNTNQNNNNESFIVSLSNKTNSFLKTKYSFIAFLGGIIFFWILNYIMFGFSINDFSVSTPWFGDILSSSSNSWIGWTEITIASLGSLLVITGVIMVIRFEKNFIIPLTIGNVLVILDASIVGAIFTALSYFLMLCSGIYSWIQWNKDADDDNKMTNKKYIFFTIGLVIYFLVGFLISNQVYGSIEWTTMIDVISSGIVVFCWLLLFNKNKYGFIGFFLTDITYIILFSAQGLIAAGSSYIVYAFIDSTSFISWYNTN